ncbi:MAG: hypothetical protein JJ895_05340 [Balneolaceae bacterium]|nr:hypothetical protein [Balneolaceae bacterium]
MSKQPDFPYNYVHEQSLLDEAANKLSTATQLSVDLEFDKNRFRYGFNLCLIQIFDGTETFLIDPIQNEMDLSAIFTLFENPELPKIVFSFGEDLRLLHSLGCFPKGLYDLQIASALLNYPPSSLATLLDEVLNIQLSKTSQQSNWYSRPLSDAQIKYAVLDVVHLPSLFDVFKDQANERSVSDWIEQEMHHFENENHEDANQNEILKEKYKEDLTEVEWHLFSRLMYLRDRHAESVNRPPYHISERKTLTNIAKNPESASDWKSVKSNHRTTKNDDFVNHLQSEINEALEEAQALELSRKRKAYKKPSKEEYEQWRDLERKVKSVKQAFFKPIQKAIKEDYGDHTKTFIINNRLIKELVEGKTYKLLPYKKELILKYSQKLDLSIDEYVPALN